VDWPVTILFWGNADDIKIRNIYGYGVPWTSSMYFYLFDDPSRGWEWDFDLGVKYIVRLGPWVTCSYPDLVVINFWLRLHAYEALWKPTPKRHYN
jgi:hypothetical protein